MEQLGFPGAGGASIRRQENAPLSFAASPSRPFTSVTRTPNVTTDDLHITNLGPRAIPSPGWKRDFAAEGSGWHSDGDRILLDDHFKSVATAMQGGGDPPTLELAGPRHEIFFNPADTCCAIVTCGGLCPGINDVIRAIVMQAYYVYGVRRILGIQFGYEGLDPAYGHKPIELTPGRGQEHPLLRRLVSRFLARPQDTKVMVNRLEALGVNILFVIGGDGSQRGAHDIYEEVQRRGGRIAIVGVPKTIDNDLMFMDRSFGYQTAFAAAFHAVTAAHTEARGARNGVGLVKLMGRDSGFIACSAALATGEANAVLIPEVPFSLEGANGLLELIERRLASRGHAVVITAEGAGRTSFPLLRRPRTLRETSFTRISVCFSRSASAGISKRRKSSSISSTSIRVTSSAASLPRRKTGFSV